MFKCCPGLSLEEFNVFRTMKMLESGELNVDEDDDEDDEELDGDSNQYTIQTKSREKIKYDPNRFRIR